MRDDGCAICKKALDFDFTMAFQPIVDPSRRRIFAHEALVRGVKGEGAGAILSKISKQNMHAFDQAARVKAIELAAQLGIGEALSINIMPNAVYNPATCLQTSIEACEKYGFPAGNVIFEFTENEQVLDKSRLSEITREYASHGFRTAIDDFGAGFSGLNLLAEYHPDIVKLDMELTRNIDQDQRRRTIVSGIVTVCRDLEIVTVAEGIESLEECETLREIGIDYFQGYFFGKPQFQEKLGLSDINFGGS